MNLRAALPCLVLVSALLASSLLDRGVWLSAAQPSAASATPVEQVTTKPRRGAGQGLGTVAYRPSEQEQPFFRRLAAEEKTTGGLAGEYDISKKAGAYVGWFGIVRTIAEN